MKHKSLTLVEIMISVFILVVGVGIIFTVYPSLFEGVEVTFQTMRAWGECRKEIETLKSKTFSTDLWPQADSAPHSFLDVPNIMRGVYYLDKISCPTSSSYCVGGFLTDVLRVTVVVSVVAKNRVIGEDKNLSGTLEPGEDVNGNVLLDSPVSLSTIVISQ